MVKGERHLAPHQLGHEGSGIVKNWKNVTLFKPNDEVIIT